LLVKIGTIFYSIPQPKFSLLNLLILILLYICSQFSGKILLTIKKEVEEA